MHEFYIIILAAAHQRAAQVTSTLPVLVRNKDVYINGSPLKPSAGRVKGAGGQVRVPEAQGEIKFRTVRLAAVLG